METEPARLRASDRRFANIREPYEEETPVTSFTFTKKTGPASARLSKPHKLVQTERDAD